MPDIEHLADGDAEVRGVLDRHHELLRDALRTARTPGQPDPPWALAGAAEPPALLAHGAGPRSRAGTDVRTLHGTVSTALASIAGRTA